jgi:hypothetical protein
VANAARDLAFLSIQSARFPQSMTGFTQTDVFFARTGQTGGTTWLAPIAQVGFPLQPVNRSRLFHFPPDTG